MAASDSERPIFAGGIAVPVKASADGGFKMATGDDYILQLITVAVGDNDSDNPFQDEVLGNNAVFQNVSDQSWRAIQRRGVQQLFNQLERAGLAKLKSVAFSDGEKPGQHQMQIMFLSLETNTPQEVTTNIRRSD